MSTVTAKDVASILSMLIFRNYRVDGSGECTVSNKDVILGRESVQCHTEKGDRYSKRCWYRKTDSYVTTYANRKHLASLQRKDLLICDGLVNLYCREKSTRHGIATYRAKWLEQSKGLSVRLITGYLATATINKTVFFCHSTDSRSEAYRGLRKKIAAYRANNLRGYVVEQLKQGPIPVDWGNVIVTKDDAIAVGYCLPGIRNFLRKHNINANRLHVRELLVIDDTMILPVAAQAIAQQY